MQGLEHAAARRLEQDQHLLDRAVVEFRYQLDLVTRRLRRAIVHVEISTPMMP